MPGFIHRNYIRFAAYGEDYVNRGAKIELALLAQPHDPEENERLVRAFEDACIKRFGYLHGVTAPTTEAEERKQRLQPFGQGGYVPPSVSWRLLEFWCGPDGDDEILDQAVEIADELGLPLIGLGEN